MISIIFTDILRGPCEEETSSGAPDLPDLAAEVSAESRGADAGHGPHLHRDPVRVLHHPGRRPLHPHLPVT